mgnify:CR=1 FL=1|tara:strand:- start:3430 stop:4125 length:696 start_codon:yes stop_codon:yes gene_type:complete
MRIVKTNNRDAMTVNLGVYGFAGSGKTTLIKTLPCDPGEIVIVSCEAGLLPLRDESLTAIECASKSDVHDAYRWICDSDESRGIQWVAFDSMSEIAEVILAEEKAKTKDGRKAYGETNEVMAKLIRTFRDLPGRNCFYTFKAETTSDDSTLLRGPSMPGNKLGQSIPYFFDFLLAMRSHRDIDAETPTVKRWLQCQPDGVWDAKDRSGNLGLYEPPNLTAILTTIHQGQNK